MTLPWKRFREADQVRAALETALPDSPTLARLQQFLRDEGLECSDLVDGVIRCSAPARSGLFFVRGKWLMEFHVRDDRLERIEVTKGLIGP